MSVAIYMDVHAPQAITDQLRRRGVDVVTAIETGMNQVEDDVLLDHARHLRRVLFTQDIGFKAMAEDWQRQSRPFAGLAYAHQLEGIGPLVQVLELIAKATDASYWQNRVEYLPY